MLVWIPSCCIASMFTYVLEILKKQNREQKKKNYRDFWKGVVQVLDDAIMKMVL